MAEKTEVLKERIPWKAFVIGFIVMVAFTLLIGAMCWEWPWRGYNQPWFLNTAQNYFTFSGGNFGWFLGLLIIAVPIGSLMGRVLKFDYREMSIVFAFYSMAGIAAFYPIVLGGVYYYLPGFYANELLKFLPDYMVLPQSEIAIIKSKVGGPMSFAAWASPLVFWSVFIISLVLMYTFISVIWRRQWQDIETLPFPSATVIYEVTNLARVESKPKILTSKLLWTGFLFGSIWHSLDFLNVASRGYYTMNSFWVNFIRANDVTATIRGFGRWNYHPAFFSLYFILPMDILLTFWINQLFFYNIKPAVGMSIGAYPLTTGSGAIEWNTQFSWFPEANPIALGVLFAVGAWTFWTGRQHLKRVWNNIRGKDPEYAEPSLSYKWALIGFVICFTIPIALVLSSRVNPTLMILSYLLIVFIGFGFTRASGEIFRSHGTWSPPAFNELAAAVTPAMTADRYLLSMWPGVLDIEPLGQGVILDNFKVAKETGGSYYKYIFVASLIACVTAIPLSLVFKNWLGYRLGGPSTDPGTTIEWPYLTYLGTPEDRFNGFSLGIGIAYGLILSFLKSMYPWFPLNPVGVVPIFGISAAPSMMIMAIAAWAVKFAVWKIGGPTLHRRALTIVLGYLGAYFLWGMIVWFTGFYLNVIAPK